MCGSTKHHEKDCPKLTANKRRKKDGVPGGSPDGGGDSSGHGSNGGSHRDAAGGSATVEKTFAETEEETIRLKSLSDLTFPSPPENAAQARKYINQVLMAISKVQRTAGDEVYIWAQECRTLSDSQLKADRRFPRLNREITAKLIRACRRGRFGLLFQQQVEQERTRSGSAKWALHAARHIQALSARARSRWNACRMQPDLQGDLFRTWRTSGTSTCT